MMKKVLCLHWESTESTETVTFLNKNIQYIRKGCRQAVHRAREIIAEYDGQVDAIALENIPVWLELGKYREAHDIGESLAGIAKKTPVTDGSTIRGGLEKWGIILADRAQPGIFSRKRVLLTPGLNHSGMAIGLERRGCKLRYADPLVYFGLPDFPGVGSRLSLDTAAAPTLERLKNMPYQRLNFESIGQKRLDHDDLFAKYDIIAGDVSIIRKCAPKLLKRKIILVNYATEADIDDLRRRDVAIVITLMPSPDGPGALGRWPAAVIEASLMAVQADGKQQFSEDVYLDLLSNLRWVPHVRYLQPGEANVNRFAFVIHPLNISFIHKHPSYRWTRNLPDGLVETISAYMPPRYLSRITGGKSPATGQLIEGHLISLGATPRQMMKRGERFTYDRLNQAAKIAERLGARIMGLGAFTSVVGDAGITVAHEADIAITSGNSLTVAATLEAAKQAVVQMGTSDLTRGKVMIIGATGSIGSVCSRLLAQAILDVVLVSIEPERLIDLKQTILKETPKAKVTIATRADELLGDCDLVVTTTSAFGQRVIDISKCKPGAVICDVARPPDINEREAALRPDVLVIESGEVCIPGDIDFGYDIGLPPGTAYACLAETALLAMEGRFEDYTLGRNITTERVKEIYHLFKKHQFQLADLRSFGKVITPADFAAKRALAAKFHENQEKFRAFQKDAGEKLARIPVMAKGVQSSSGNGVAKTVGAALAIGTAAYLLGKRKGKKGAK